MSLEEYFDPTFAATLAIREKQIQQNYRPIIGIHKWFARRPGTVFRNLLLAEFNGQEALKESYWHAHELRGVIADPFMGGGTPIYEANRLGFSVVGSDINPMAYWIVRQALGLIDLEALSLAAESVVTDVERTIGTFYHTRCVECGRQATVKYFLWVKVETCPQCGFDNDLFPGYLLAEATRHPRHVLVCSSCGTLNEYDYQPAEERPEICTECGCKVQLKGPAQRQHIDCRNCSTKYSYPPAKPLHPPRHRMWAIEYHCENCKPTHIGRFFKHPNDEDLTRFEQASILLAQNPHLPIPDDEIPNGDETNRLHRWGYQYYRQMFNQRQLVGLGLLLSRICRIEQTDVRHALLTIFSDFLRYQNMLCRYDTYALKCQDIFSVHGFPVGLIQCENNILGIPKVGSGSFRHFIEKYLRAKRYCERPFETRYQGRSKEVIFILGEHIRAQFVNTFPTAPERQAYLRATPATEIHLPPLSLDGVFTDPPYFDNVQYAELMDFCFSWLRIALQEEFQAFRTTTTRTLAELTGNITLGKGIMHFTQGISAVFCHYAAALKIGAPFVFTYHHNDPVAYVPIAVAVLDAEMSCTASLPAVAEMNASLHISGKNSSVLDSVFVCRIETPRQYNEDLEASLRADIVAIEAAGIHITEGDIRCLGAGHVARIVINRLRGDWNIQIPLEERIRRVKENIIDLSGQLQVNALISDHRRTVEDENKPEEETFAKTI